MLTESEAGAGREPGSPFAARAPEAEGGAGRCAWVLGDCWLWCRRTGTAVTWLGPVTSWGTHAPLYACEECIRRLEEQVRSSPVHQDTACWLWCGRDDVPLALLAEVQHEDGTTFFYACGECVGRLRRMVLDRAMDKDAAKR
ncbi:hypothetical protein GCM10010420_16460 [Streptomyces glaucosporus]|uniref:Uncharacterized protein n=1 Tax=Streptomyces glaucosporus TaxID=284044 RepID=A0ABN3I200_9ACTN